MDNNSQINIKVSLLLSIVKNLHKVSHNIEAFEDYLGNKNEWNEAMILRQNRFYIESLLRTLKQLIVQ